MASNQPLLVVNPLELDDLLPGVQVFLRQPGRGARAPKQLKARWELFRLLARPLIRRTLGRRGVCGLELDDLTQETWVILFRKLPEFQPTGPVCVAAWIGRIAARVATRHWRRAKSASAAKFVSAALDSLAAAEPGPVATVERQDELERVHDAITEVRRVLSQTNRTILDEYLLGGRSAEDVAHDLGIGAARVRDAAWRLRRKLIRALRRRKLG